MKLLILLLPFAVQAAELNELNHDRLHDFADMVPIVKTLAEDCYAETGIKARTSYSCSEFRSKFLELHELKVQTDRIDSEIRYAAVANSNKLYYAFRQWDYVIILSKNKEQMRGHYK